MRILPFIAALLIACSGNGGGRAPKAALPADTPTQAGHSTLPRDTVTQSLSATALSMERQGMVNVQSVDPTIRVSLMYSRPDNFTGRVLYDDLREGYLHPKAAKALAMAQKRLKELRPELSLIIFDATRPISIQQKMWNVVKGT